MQIGYNTTETTSFLWNAALSSKDTSTKPRGKTKKSDNIYYPQFEAASQYIEDEYWKVILHNCARKKFPRGFNFNDGILKYRVNNISIALPDDYVSLAQTAIHFFQENGKLYSKRDQEIRKKQDEAIIINQLINNSNNWTCISRSKNRRATYIRDYVERKYINFPQYIRDELYTQLNIAFETKYITKEHVNFENGLITNIDGIDANDTSVFFTRPFSFLKITHYNEDYLQQKNKCHRHFENWCKYMDEYYKYITTNKSNFIHSSSSTSDSDEYNSHENSTHIENSPF